MAETVKFDETTADQPNSTSGDESVNILDVNSYLFIEQAFYGKEGFKDGTYLNPHHREMFYNKRRRAAHYANYVNPVITAMYKAVFADPVTRDQENERFKLFEKDCTSHGVNLNDFVKLVVKYTRMHGMVLIVVDNKIQNVELRKDALDLGLNPYCYIKKAYEINEDGTWFDDNGKLTAIMYFDHSEVEKEKTISYYRQWTPTESILYKEKENTNDSPAFADKYEVYDSQVNELGEIPCYLMYEEPLDDPKKLFADTLRYPLAKINATVFNQDSEIREVERNQGFGILTIPEDGNESKDKTIGTGNYLGYPMDSRHAPEMINVEPDLITSLANQRQRTMEALITIAEQSGVQGINKSNDAKSGLAYAFEFFAYESTLKDSSVLAMKAETNILLLFNKWTKENVEYDIKYPVNFKPNQTAEKYEQLTETMEQPNLTQQFFDKCEIEKYIMMFPDDEEGLEELKKQQSTREPELKNDLDTNDNIKS